MALKKFPLQVVLSAVDRISGPIRRFAAVVRSTFSPLSRLQSKLSSLNRSLGIPRLLKGFKGVSSAVGGLASALQTAIFKATALGAVVAGSVAALVRTYATAGDNVAKTAAKIGVGIEALQEYRFAADRAGIRQETFDMALQRFGRRMGEVAQGTGEARNAVRALGIEVLDANGKVRSIESLLPELADKLSRVESANVRNALAMKFFDSEGVVMVNLLEHGAAGMEALRQRARDLGLVLSADAARGAETFTDAQTDLFASLSGLRNIIGAAVLPQVTALAGELTAFVVENRPRIQRFATEFAAKLPERLEAIREGVVELIFIFQPLLDAGAWLVERFGAVRLVALALGAAILGPVALAMGTLIASVWSLGAAILATPIGWILAALAALAASAWFLWDNWGTVLEYLKLAWRAFTWPIRTWVSFILDFFPKLDRIIPEWFKDLIGLGGNVAVSADSTSTEVLENGLSSATSSALDAAGTPGTPGRAAVEVDFKNLPKGATVESKAAGGTDLDVGVGYSLEGF